MLIDNRLTSPVQNGTVLEVVMVYHVHTGLNTTKLAINFSKNTQQTQMGNNVNQRHQKFQLASLVIKRSNGRYIPVRIHTHTHVEKWLSL